MFFAGSFLFKIILEGFINDVNVRHAPMCARARTTKNKRSLHNLSN
jgi:hypothetical protein